MTKKDLETKALALEEKLDLSERVRKEGGATARMNQRTAVSSRPR